MNKPLSEMSNDEVVEMILQCHDPEEIKKQSVSLICWDGEHISTKAGDLFGRRTFHSLRELPFSQDLKSKLKQKMPVPTKALGEHPHILCSFDTAKRLEELFLAH